MIPFIIVWQSIAYPALFSESYCLEHVVPKAQYHFTMSYALPKRLKNTLKACTKQKFYTIPNSKECHRAKKDITQIKVINFNSPPMAMETYNQCLYHQVIDATSEWVFWRKDPKEKRVKCLREKKALADIDKVTQDKKNSLQQLLDSMAKIQKKISKENSVSYGLKNNQTIDPNDPKYSLWYQSRIKVEILEDKIKKLKLESKYINETISYLKSEKLKKQKIIKKMGCTSIWKS